MFNPDEEYDCSPETKCRGFTELMYFVSYFPEELNKIDDLATPNTIDLKNNEGWTALMIASRNSNKISNSNIGNEVVKLLLKKGADPNIQNPNGWTPLMIASRYSNTTSNNETVELLLKGGGNPNLQTSGGYTALMIASRYSNTESSNDTVELLLKNDANPNLQNIDKETALMLASYSSNTTSNIKTVELLLKNGADPNIQYYDGSYVLEMVSGSKYARRYEVVELLLENGADINHQNNDGWTALMMATRYPVNENNIKVVELLLQKGADPNIQNEYKETALMMASDSKKANSIETIELLLKYGAYPNLQNEDKETALMLVSRHFKKDNSIETVKLLLKYGAYPYSGLKECPTKECEELISKHIWKGIKSNIDLVSSKYSKQTTISKDMWGLILLKHKQKQLCRDLSSNKNRLILLEFAEMLFLPVNENTTKTELCRMISKQLTYGEPYSQRSVEYFRRQDRIDIIVEAAKKLGINIDQPVDKILNDMTELIVS